MYESSTGARGLLGGQGGPTSRADWLQ